MRTPRWPVSSARSRPVRCVGRGSPHRVDAQLIEDSSEMRAWDGRAAMTRPTAAPPARPDAALKRAAPLACNSDGRGRSPAGRHFSNDDMIGATRGGTTVESRWSSGDPALPLCPSPIPSSTVEDFDDGVAGRPSSPCVVRPRRIRSPLRADGAVVGCVAGPRRASPPRIRFRRVAEDGLGVIANYIHDDAPGAPSQQVRWVADVFARLFFTYLSMPPKDPDFGDDAELRRFAHEILTPMVKRAVG